MFASKVTTSSTDQNTKGKHTNPVIVENVSY